MDRSPASAVCIRHPLPLWARCLTCYGAGICSEQISSCTMGVLGTGVTFIMYAIPSNPERQAATRAPGGVRVRIVAFGVADPGHSGPWFRQGHIGSGWTRAGSRGRPRG